MSDIDPRVAADFFALVLLAGAALLALALTRPTSRGAVAADSLRLTAVLASGAMAGELPSPIRFGRSDLRRSRV